MSRRSIPPIAPTDLRDHADEERIGRIWERIEHDLGGTESSPRRSNGLAVALLAAAAMAFGGGLLVGKLVWRESPSQAIPATASPDRPALDVFAAGSQPRTFTLPGGGEITLRPGTTMELERSDGDALTLRLIQGEATVDAEPRAAAFAVVVGDVRLASRAGSVLSVRRDADQMAVKVTNGSVSLTQPSGTREQLEAGQSRESIPLHAVTALVPTTMRHEKAPVSPSATPVDGQPPIEPPPVATAAATDWHTASGAGDFAGALKLMRDQPGGIPGAIAAAKDAKELYSISDVARSKGGDVGAAIVALTRIVDAFPSDPLAPFAAYQLGDIFERQGQSAKAQQYFQRAKSSPAFADDASCRQLRAARGGIKDETIKMAKEYLGKFPNGRCRDEADRVAKGEDTSRDEEAPPPEGDAGAH